MKCNFCDNVAHIFLTQVEDQELRKISLCETCSKNSELLSKEGILSVFADTLNLEEEEEVSPPSPSLVDLPDLEEEAQSISCEECGFSVHELSSTGRLGCSHCYEAFESILPPRIKAFHKGISHQGKTLKLTESKKSVEKQISKTNLALKTAIDDEEFEKAASLRDILSSLKEKLSTL